MTSLRTFPVMHAAADVSSSADFWQRLGFDRFSNCLLTANLATSACVEVPVRLPSKPGTGLRYVTG